VRGDRHGIEVVMETFFAQMVRLIERAQNRNEISGSVDPLFLAHNLFALYFAFLVLWLGSGEQSPDRRSPSLRQMLELQLNGAVRRGRNGRGDRDRSAKRRTIER